MVPITDSQMVSKWVTFSPVISKAAKMNGREQRVSPARVAIVHAHEAVQSRQLCPERITHGVAIELEDRELGNTMRCSSRCFARGRWGKNQSAGNRG